MKNKLFILAGLTAVLAFSSCEEDLPLYQDDQAKLNFEYNYSRSDSIISYSFVYNGGIQEDTVWLQLNTMGYVSDQERHFELQQVPSGKTDAVAGTHYVSFDDTSYKSKYLMVPAGATSVKVPIIMLRDASLKDGNVYLKVAVRDGIDFTAGYDDLKYKTVTFNDYLSKPDAWGAAMNWYFGQYGTAKHQFMIDTIGEKWDDDYINSFINDFGYVTYLISKLNKALTEENSRRAALGLSPLSESDGTLVTIGMGY